MAVMPMVQEKGNLGDRVDVGVKSCKNRIRREALPISLVHTFLL